MEYLNSIVELLLRLLTPFSEAYGTGDPRGDLSFILVLLLLIGGILLAFVVITGAGGKKPRPRKSGSEGSGEGFDRYSALGGKLERLEMEMNNSRTEVLREVELLKSRVDVLEAQLIEVTGGETPPLTVLPGGSEGASEGTGAEPELPAGAPLPTGIPDPRTSNTEEIDADDFESSYPPQGKQSGKHQPTVVIPAEDLDDLRAGKEDKDSTVARESGATPREIRSLERDEVEEKAQLTSRLQKTRRGLFQRIREVFSGKEKLDADMVEELQAFLVSTDLGLQMVRQLTDELQEEVSRGEELTQEKLLKRLRAQVLTRLNRISGAAHEIVPQKQSDGPLVVVMVGVNGVGKTTTTAKLADMWKSQGARVLLVAADTFRAAAVEQLHRWGEELGIPVVSGEENAKPSTVVFSAMERAKGDDFDVVLVDTAGRLHTKSNLMQELEGIRNAITRHCPSAPHEVLLVVDGTTGQNALQQAEEFNESVPLTGLVVTKLDGTPKGGIVVAIQDKLGVPIRYIGVGEASSDLKVFHPNDFTDALFDDSEVDSTEEPTAHGRKRRRRRA